MKILNSIILLVLIFILGACSDYDDGFTRSKDYDQGLILERVYGFYPLKQIVDWWEREHQWSFSEYKEVDTAYILHEREVVGYDLYGVITEALEIKKWFEYEDEGSASYWKSYQEVKDQRCGDCEDFHIFLYIECCRKGLIPSDRSGVVAAYDTQMGTYHAMMFLYPYEDESVFLVFNYSAMSWVDVQERYIPIFACTLNEYWRYGPY